MTRLTPKSALLAALLVFTCAARAQVVMPTLLADHMVLQRDMPIRIWGAASPGEQVSVDLNGSTKTTKAGADGKWSVDLPEMKAGGPYELHVKGKNSITLKDIMIGDVWLAAGQSNVGLTMDAWAKKGHPEKPSNANQPDIRLFEVDHTTAPTPQDNVKAELPWSRCSADNYGNFSALGYYFAKDLQAAEHVPVGIINASWGETSAESWTSFDAIKANPKLQGDLDAYKAILVKNPASKRPAPGSIYNTMINPLLPLRIRGVIWFQGSNDANPDFSKFYNDLMQTLFTSWRQSWGEGNFPVIYAQVGHFPGEGNRGPEDWLILRDAQRRTLVLPNSAMVLTTDLGDPKHMEDNHAVSKPGIADRMMLAARALSYGEHIEYEGPLYDHAKVEGRSIRVYFTHAGGLMSKTPTIQDFEIAGADHKFVPATAKIDGETVVVTAASVPNPVYVRYEWVGTPAVSLYNGANLPASQFTSEP